MMLPVARYLRMGASGRAKTGGRPVSLRMSQGVSRSPKFPWLGIRHQKA
jgi:hypothetical protein